MRSRKFFFLPFVLAIGAACSDANLFEPDRQAKSTGGGARAERQRMARQSLAMQSDEDSSTSAGVSITSAANMATALDIPAGLVTGAQLTTPDPEASLVLPNFGVIRPRQGTSMVVMSTGRINLKHLPEPGTDFLPDGADGEAVTLRVTVNVPPGANRLSFDYNFLSSEAPDYVGSEFNDVFTAKVTDALGSRVAATASVNSSFFYDVSATRAGDTGFDLLFADDPSGTDLFPGEYPLGTQLFPDSGLTGFQTANVEVKGGGLVTLEFDIRDLGDGFLDSTVVVDNVNFSTTEVVDPNPGLVDGMGNVVTAPEALAVGGTPVQSVAADGATQLLLRVKVPGPGTMKFSLPAGVGGGVGAVGTDARSASVTVDAVQATPGQYYAFALFTSPEDFVITGYADKKTRPMSISAEYTPTTGGGFVGQKDIAIVRPPVVVVHDIWSSCLYWQGAGDIYKNPLFEVTCPDYSATNWASLEVNKNVVPNGVNDALKKMRTRGIAVTQVDVIAHGMGGLLARKFVDQPNYSIPGNFNKGYLNRLITMNTPHLGTRIADEIVEMREALKAKGAASWNPTKNSLKAVGIVIDGTGPVAVDDLRANNTTIKNIKETRVPSHAMVSVGGLDWDRNLSLPMLSDDVRMLYQQMEFKHPDAVKLAATVDKQKLILGKESMFFCADQHDLFAAEADQKGGVPLNAVSKFNLEFAAEAPNQDSEHFKVPSDDKHHTKLVDLLNSPIGGGLFAPSIPSPGNVNPVNSCNGGAFAPLVQGASTRTTSSAQSLQQGTLKIVSPNAGTPVSPGRSVKVVVEASDGFQPSLVFIAGAGEAVFLETAPFVAEFPIPAHAIGTIELVAFGIDAQGESLESNTVFLPVASSAKLASMEVLNGDTFLQRPESTRQLLVLGKYDDGTTRNISSPSFGTVYSSSNTNVATVASDGTVTGMGPGIATITVRNGTTFTSITATVGNERPDDQPDDQPDHCIEVRLSDYNLFVLEDYIQGHYIDGRVAAGGNIFLQGFSVGSMLAETDLANVLVAGGDLSLSGGGVWGDVRYGGQLSSDTSVSLVRGSESRGTPIDFADRGSKLRTLSSELAALPVNGTTTIESSWGGILLRGTAADVNVFDVDSRAFTGASLLFIDAPAGSLAIINVRGTSATFTNFGQDLNGGIDEHGVLFNFPDATSLSASGYGFLGTVLAPQAHVTFNSGAWHGGLYARSLTGDASGHLYRLRDTDICL